MPYAIAVNSKADIVRMYDLIFNPIMRCAIERSTLSTRDVPHPSRSPNPARSTKIDEIKVVA
jgi:hypothetical protein